MRWAGSCAGAPATGRSSRRSSAPWPPRRRRRRADAGRRPARPSALACRASTAPDQVTGRTRFGADVAPPDALVLRAIRSPHAHARFEIGDLGATDRRASGPRPRPGRGGCPRREPVRHLPARQGPAGPRRRGRPLSGRGGRGPRRRARDDRPDPGRRPCRSPGIRSSRSSTWTRPCGRDAPRLHDGLPGNVLISGRVARGDVRGGAGHGRRHGDRDVHDDPRRARLHRAGGRPRHPLGRPVDGRRLDPDAVHGPRRAGAHPGSRPGRRPGRPDRLRRRLRRQARHRHPAARRGRRLGPRSSGPWRLHPAGVDAGDDQAPPGADDGDHRRGRRGPADRRRVPRRLRHRGVRRRGARPSPIACPSTPVDPYAVRGGPGDDPGHPHERPASPARSAASASRRRPSRGEALVDDLAAQLGLDRLEIRLPQRPPRRVDDRDRPGPDGERRAGAVPRGAPPGLDDGPGRGRCGQRAGGGRRRPDPARRRHRGDVVRHRQHVAAQPVDDAGRARGGTARTSCSAAPRTSARGRTRSCRRSPPMPWRRRSAPSPSSTGDTDRTPDAGKTSASRQTFVSGNAARAAAEDLLRRVELAGPDLRRPARGRGRVHRRRRRQLRPADDPPGRQRSGGPVRDLRVRRPDRPRRRRPGARHDRGPAGHRGARRRAGHQSDCSSRGRSPAASPRASASR